MAQIDVLKAQIVRNNVSTPWGFRLQGGAEHGQALSLMRVTPGSPAARIGLKSGDEVTEIGEIPTENMPQQEAYQHINSHGESLVLTVERRASGGIPNNPVITPGEELRPKAYEPYDMAKPAHVQRPRHQPQPAPPVQQPITMVEGVEGIPGFIPGYIQAVQPGKPPSPPPQPKNYQTFDFNRPSHYKAPPQPSYDFQTVQARPYVEPPSRPAYHSPPPQPPPPQQFETQVPQPPHYSNYEPYVEDAPDGAASQSRTFRVLQNLMQGDEPHAGVQGLPPPRSAAMDRMKQEEAARRQQQRVKVLMPQQYNSPLGMYSAKNVVETFTTQAEGYMDTMDRQDEETQRQNQQYAQQPIHGQQYTM